jgi:hypothetical protein
MARKPNIQPATIYDYRRCKALCDVLAIDHAIKRFTGLRTLAEGWGVPILNHESQMKLASRLAQHALEHGREQ